MTWTHVGYFPKRRTIKPGVFPSQPQPDVEVARPLRHEEICSVSECGAEGPAGWREIGKQNFCDRYDSPELAWSMVPAEDRADYDVYSYRLYMVKFQDGQEEVIDNWWDLDVVPMDDSFVLLGWDAVVGGNGHSFGCSPLSCNNQAGERGIPPVNRYCLVGSAEEGIELARQFSITKPEPGPYCVVEVWRKYCLEDTHN